MLKDWDKLSAVIITLNEERNIGRCIESLLPVADEIVILDSGSTDRTREIACSYEKVRFFVHPFDGYTSQKNRAKDLASYDWVLSLDADESLDETLKESILKIKGKWDRDGYFMNRMTFYCGRWIKHSKWYPDRKIRLWNRKKGEWKGGALHEKVELIEGEKSSGYLRGNILHYSFYTPEDHYRKIEHYSDIAARAFLEDGRRFYGWEPILYPIGRFLDHYIFHLGFLDGKAGWEIARLSAYATFLKYKKIQNLFAIKGGEKRKKQ